MSHLGERVSGLVDGQLSAADTERAMAHLAGCRACRDAVETERLMKARLACLSGPEPSDGLLGRLLAMGGPSGPLPPRPGYVPGSPRPQSVPLSRPVAVPVGAVAVRATVGARAGSAVSGATVLAEAEHGVEAVAGRAGRAGLLAARAAGRAGRAADQVTGRAARAVRRAGVVRPVPARPLTARPAGRPTGLGAHRARLAGAVLGALGVVGAGVGGLVIAAPGVPAGAGSGTDNLTIQQPARPGLPGPGVRRRVPSATDTGAPGSMIMGASVPAGASVLAVDLTGRPSTPPAPAYHSGR